MAETTLVVTDIGGYHNLHPDETHARLTRGGSWKKQRVIVILPSSDMISARVALSHRGLCFPPNNGMTWILALGQEVGQAYSDAIAGILLHPDLSQWEFILTIESDNMPPSDGLLKLIEDMEEHPEFDCIGGLYFTKGPGGVAQMWGDPMDPVTNFRPMRPVPEQMVEVCGTGMGFNLWRLSMFKDERIKKPWFETKAGAQGVATQDLAFWAEARKWGHRCAIDCRVRVGHFDREGTFGVRDFIW